jgi:hypothetical protein
MLPDPYPKWSAPVFARADLIGTENCRIGEKIGFVIVTDATTITAASFSFGTGAGHFPSRPVPTGSSRSPNSGP